MNELDVCNRHTTRLNHYNYINNQYVMMYFLNRDKELTALKIHRGQKNGVFSALHYLSGIDTISWALSVLPIASNAKN